MSGDVAVPAVEGEVLPPTWAEVCQRIDDPLARELAELHAPRPDRWIGSQCDGCGPVTADFSDGSWEVDWPCDTVVAVLTALGLPTDGSSVRQP